MLKIENLNKKYKYNNILEDVNVQIQKGGIVGIVGRNGSGKTTLINCIAGFQTFSGKIIFKNKKIKHNFSYVSDKRELFYLTIKENIAFYKNVFSDFNKARFDEISKEFNLDIDKKLLDLSNGENAKLKLALALSRDTDLYFLDEPFNGLDPIFKDSMIDLIISYIDVNNKIIFIASHDLDLIERLIDSVIIINKNKVEYIDDLEKFREKNGESLLSWYKHNMKGTDEIEK